MITVQREYLKKAKKLQTKTMVDLMERERQNKTVQEHTSAVPAISLSRRREYAKKAQ